MKKTSLIAISILTFSLSTQVFAQSVTATNVTDSAPTDVSDFVSGLTDQEVDEIMSMDIFPSLDEEVADFVTDQVTDQVQGNVKDVVTDKIAHRKDAHLKDARIKHERVERFLNNNPGIAEAIQNEPNKAKAIHNILEKHPKLRHEILERRKNHKLRAQEIREFNKSHPGFVDHVINGTPAQREAFLAKHPKAAEFAKKNSRFIDRSIAHRKHARIRHEKLAHEKDARIKDERRAHEKDARIKDERKAHKRSAKKQEVHNKKARHGGERRGDSPRRAGGRGGERGHH